MKLTILLFGMMLSVWHSAAGVQESKGASCSSCDGSNEQREPGVVMLQRQTTLASSRSLNSSKDYEAVMTEVIHRHGGSPAAGSNECWMPPCRRAGCDDFHPECCNAQMARMLSDVASFLQRKGHDFAPTFGTLLGAVRNQSIIPWTADVDLSVSPDGVEALLTQEEIPYRFFRPPKDAVVRGCPYYEHGDQRHWLGGAVAFPEQDDHKSVFFYMDIYADYVFNYSKGWDRCLRADNATAKNQVQIYDLKLPTVISAEECLRVCYGQDWMVPRHKDLGDRMSLIDSALTREFAPIS